MEKTTVVKRKVYKKKRVRKARLNTGNYAFMGKVVKRVHEWSSPIYCYSTSTGETGTYTFANNSTAVFQLNLLPSLFGLSEFVSMKTDYQLMKIKGVTFELRATSNTSGQQNLISSSQLYCDLFLSMPALQTNQYVPSSQSAIKIIPMSGGYARKYYSFPDIIAGNQGYPQVGSKLWYNTTQISDATTNVSLIAGIGFTNYSQTTALFNYKVAELTFKFYIEWARPCRTQSQ